MCFIWNRIRPAGSGIIFVKGYFGEDFDPDEAEHMLKPYAALKLLIIERDAKEALPWYHWLLKD